MTPATTPATTVHHTAGRLLLEIDRDQDGVIARWDGERFTVELDPVRTAEFLRACERLIPKPPPVVAPTPKYVGYIFDEKRNGSVMLDEKVASFLDHADCDTLLLTRDKTSAHTSYDLHRIFSLDAQPETTNHNQ
jgi:hypothetical protein